MIDIQQNLYELRKKFHISLARNRGLNVRILDLSDKWMAKEDADIQKYLERLNTWRNVFSIMRKR